MFKTVSEPGRTGNGTALYAPNAIMGSLLQPHQLADAVPQERKLVKASLLGEG